MKKIAFVLNIPAPFMVKLCKALGSVYCVKLYAYKKSLSIRENFWNINLDNGIVVLDDTKELVGGRYYSKSLKHNIATFNPDVIMIGGWSIPSNYLLYRWGLKNNKKIILLGEIRFDHMGEVKEGWFFEKLLYCLYKKIDSFIALGGSQTKAYYEKIGFCESIVKDIQYPVDIEKNKLHTLRSVNLQNLRFIFPHRMIHRYNPMLVIDWFKVIKQKYPASTLSMNNAGDLKHKVVEKINKYNLSESISFMENIKTWDDLSKTYENADICLSPIHPEAKATYLTTIEALASGLGIIKSEAQEDINLMIKEFNSGFIINDIFSTEKVLRCVDSYVDTGHLLSLHGENNKKIAEKFSVENTAKKYYTLIEDLFVQ